MAIGLCTAAAVMPVIIHGPHLSELPTQIQSNTHLPAALAHEAIFIVTAAIGSLLPDLDQQNSLAARKVEGVAHIAMAVFLVLGIFMLNLVAFPMAWIAAALLWLGLTLRANTARKVMLVALAAGVMVLAFTGRVPFTGACLAAVWSLGAAFTKHRTFTHSVIGIFLFVVTVHALTHHVAGGAMGWGLGIGYVMHVVADAITKDGIALFWPLCRRFGLSLVKTGGRVDHVIGAGAVILFIVRLAGVPL